MLGDPDGEDRLKRAVEIARSVHHIEDLFRAYGNLGLVLEHAGRLRDAAKVTQQGLDEARQLDLINTRQGTILANNTSAALVLLGEWDDAETIITEVSMDRPVAETLYPRLTLAEIKVARGEYDQAHQLLDSIATVELGQDPRFLGPLHTTRAELALDEGDLARAVAEVKHGVDAVRGTDNTVELLRLCAVGLRSAAEQTARRPVSEAKRTDAMNTGDWLAREAADANRASPTDETEQLLRLCQAERQRIQYLDTPAVWRHVAGGWTELDRPFPAACARFRQAAALVAAGDRSEAASVLRAVHQVAVDLQAGPLRAKVVALARKIGLDVERAPRVQRPYNLTEAEFETLRFLADGKDTAAIAKQRTVAHRTVTTQLGSIYQKLGVSSAREAVARAHKERLFE
jgi:DNA-binding CsgD family transcriptional regulator